MLVLFKGLVSVVLFAVLFLVLLVFCDRLVKLWTLPIWLVDELGEVVVFVSRLFALVFVSSDKIEVLVLPVDKLVFSVGLLDINFPWELCCEFFFLSSYIIATSNTTT